jgi:zinc/manganese transport system permease protein
MLYVMAGVSVFTLAALALIYRPLVVESFDPVFLRSVRGKGGWVHALFLALAVLNMVESYRAMGTLMAAGLMLIPAIAAQFWTQRLVPMLMIAIGIGMSGAVVGLGLAYAYKLPSGPAIILIVGAMYIVSLLLGRFGSIRARYFPFRHLER